jgi:thiamine biosynthesis protein ThiI
LTELDIDHLNTKKVICLLSGGLDSPVACYTLIKKGFTPIFLYLDNNPFAGESTKQNTIDMARKLTEFLPNKEAKLYIVPQGFSMNMFLKKSLKTYVKYTCIFCKRMMYRIAEKIAKIEGGCAIATGEIIGEQASQTLDNLAILHQAIKSCVIFRPLIAWDKQEVVDKAKEIGTYDIADRQSAPCTLPPKKPVTRGRIEKILEIEAMIDIDALVQKSLNEKIVLKVATHILI